MPLMVTVSGDNEPREPVSAGPHPAVCWGVWDIGTQPDMRFGPKHKVLIGWEVGDQRMTLMRDNEEVDVPMVISNDYTLSLGERANLRKMLESWRSRPFTEEELDGFDLETILGQPCMINVSHNVRGKDKKVFANVDTLMPLPKGMPVPVLEGEPMFFSLEDGTDIPERTPAWIKKKIEQSEEWVAMGQASAGQAATQSALVNGEQDVGNTEPDDQQPPAPPPFDADATDLPF